MAHAIELNSPKHPGHNSALETDSPARLPEHNWLHRIFNYTRS